MASGWVLAVVIGSNITTMGQYSDSLDCQLEARAWHDQGIKAVCHQQRVDPDRAENDAYQTKRIESMAAAQTAQQEAKKKSQ